MILLLLLSLQATAITSLAFTTTNTGQGKTAIIAGATGYIGKSVVRESVRQGYDTYALVRDVSKVNSETGKLMYDQYFNGANVIKCDVTDKDNLDKVFEEICSKSKSGNIDSVISCLASRSGIKKDAYAIDYQATLNCLEASQTLTQSSKSTTTTPPHFVLLSAFCVKNPWLQFQQAKLKFEAALREQSDVPYSIVRPTAFFKSVSGQLEVVQQGAPFVMFGDGEVTSCNPISEADLATYLVDCIADPARKNAILDIGGPDEPLTMKKQGEVSISTN